MVAYKVNELIQTPSTHKMEAFGNVTNGTLNKNPSAFGVGTLGDQSLNEIQALRNNLGDLKQKTMKSDKDLLEKQQRMLMNELNVLQEESKHSNTTRGDKSNKS